VWGEEECIQRFDGEIERKRLLGRNRHQLEDNIEMDLHDVEWVMHGLD